MQQCVDVLTGSHWYALRKPLQDTALQTEHTPSSQLDISLICYEQAAHLDNIKREVAVLARLRGTLNVVHFKRAYEDDTHVHIIMEVTARSAQCIDCS